MIHKTSPTILCFGEVLWDSLPQGLFPGGAPINVAYHLKQLGDRAIPITAVGNDFLGQELVQRLRRWGLETDYISILPHKLTGAVQVQVDAKGSATYTIIEDVAWDWIELSSELEEVASQSRALVYGTLAQRSKHNRQQLTWLMERALKALKVYDVNLRPPFDSPELVWQLAKKADVIKLNDDELQKLLGKTLGRDALESGAQELAAITGCSRVCITAGAKGAGLLLDGNWFWAESEPITVADTIGAGDAFLAALVHGLLAGTVSPHDVLERASRLAEFVASNAGATPHYSISAEGQIQVPGK
ncbi:MAG: carbohydrate kinase [Verrucomicrobia bacterium]|nr:carbohydrate kinase [Verrucomicrobiota bacterium]